MEQSRVEPVWCSFLVVSISVFLIFFELITLFFPTISVNNNLISLFNIEKISVSTFVIIISLSILLLRDENIATHSRNAAYVFIFAVIIGCIVNIYYYISAFSIYAKLTPILALENFLLISFALLLLMHRFYIFQIILLIVFLNSFFSLLGYLFQVNTAYSIALYTRMELTTSFIFFSLVFAILFMRPQKGIMYLFLDNTISGKLLRRIPIIILLLSTLCALLVDKGQNIGWYDDKFGDILTLIFTTTIIITIFCLNAILLTREEKKRNIAEFELNKSTIKLHDVIKKDSLTGLMNIVTFKEKINYKINANPADVFPIVIVEIEKLKFIAETMGYEIGNELLILIANTLHRHCDERDLLFRMSDDKFGMAPINVVNNNQAAEYISKIFHIFKKIFHIKNHDFFILLNVGVSFYPTDDENIDTLLKKANIALLNAKNTAGNNFQFYNKSLNLISDKLTLENELRQALSNNQFILNYQPKISLHTGMIAGAEWLIRWQHPKRGLLSPNIFMPLAEESDLIILLTEWIIREVCNQLMLSKLPIPIAINISANHFIAEYHLSNYLKQMIKGFHLQPMQLELEITESAFMYDIHHALAMLANLKGLGFSLTLDDFGTKFSSLSYLKNIVVDKIKIDKSFIDNIPYVKEDILILQSMLNLFHHLDKKVIVEGIEKKEQLLFLLATGCDEAQGYYFAKPLDFTDLVSLIEHKKIFPLL